MVEDLSRRLFLAKAAKLGAGAALVGATSSLAGCGVLPKKSYLTKLNGDPKNPMHYWLDVMLQTTTQLPLNPPVASRAFAMAHMAGFLAVNGIEQKYNTPYQLQAGPKDANVNVAFGVAFARAFAEGAQTSILFDKMDFLDRYPDGEAKSRAVAYAEYVSNAVIDSRIQDGAEASKSQSYLGRYERRNDALRWSPTGSFYGSIPGPETASFARGLLPGWGYVKPWVIKNKEQFMATAFVEPNSKKMQEMYEKVRLLGDAKSTERTTKQTEIAYFWEAGSRTATPPGMWQLLALQLLRESKLPLIEQSRLYAMMSMAQADVAISTWHTKYVYDTVRPETAIRQRGDEFKELGLNVTGDSTWQSLLPTPPFPAYTSGHSGFSAASAAVLAQFFGKDNVRFSSVSLDNINWPSQLRNVSMSWNSFSEAADQAGASREYGGIHWEADNNAGLKMGRDIGNYVAKNAFTRKG